MRLAIRGMLAIVVCAATGCLLEVDKTSTGGSAGTGASAGTGGSAAGAAGTGVGGTSTAGSAGSSGSAGTAGTAGSAGSAATGCGTGETCVAKTLLFLTDSTCPAGSKEVDPLFDCNQCACEAMGSGNCTVDGYLTKCGVGGMAGFADDGTCTDVNQFSGVVANTILDSGSCNVVKATMPVSTRKVCELTISGSCPDGSCVDTDLAKKGCVKLSGVNACPAGFPYWSYVAAADGGDCNCACEACGDKIVTVFPETGCLKGTGAVVAADGQCTESGFAHVYSVELPPSEPLHCVKRGKPAGATDRLCCSALP